MTDEIPSSPGQAQKQEVSQANDPTRDRDDEYRLYRLEVMRDRLDSERRERADALRKERFPRR